MQPGGHRFEPGILHFVWLQRLRVFAVGSREPKKFVVFACTVAARTIQSKVPAHAGCEARKTPDRVSQEGPGESAPGPDKFRGAIRPPDDL